MGKGEANGRTDAPTFCEIFLAIILPPIGVFLKYGCSVRPHNQQLSALFFSFAVAFFLFKKKNLVSSSLSPLHVLFLLLPFFLFKSLLR